MTERGGRASHIHAVIGPSAGPCCYEVSPEIAHLWTTLGLPVTGRMLDLWGAAVMQLESRGVPREQISVSGFCTICTDRFYSYRRGDDRPRNLAFVVV
jgi:copper oxidase (laccase) domain-containing protein